MGSWVDEISDEEIEQLWENPPDNSVPLDSATIVYFDQNAWGDLLTGYHNEDSEYSQAYETIKDSTQDQDFIYPFSFSNIIETGAHRDEDFRRELYELIFDISGNYSLKNYLDVIRLEANAYVSDTIPLLTPINVRSSVIGKGELNTLGEFKITPSDFLTDEQREKLKRILASDELNRRFFQSDEMTQQISQQENQLEEYIETIEDIREGTTPAGTSDEREARKEYIATAFGDQITPLIQDTAQQLGYNLMGALARDAQREIQFLKQFPAFYTYGNFSFARDSHRDRDIEYGDLKDIMSLSVATPYCDIVVTEQFFGGMIHKYDLPEEYDTTVLFDITDLADIIQNDGP